MSTKQVPTVGITAEEVMAWPAFALGVADVRANRPMHRDYDCWDTDDQWMYERGRMWARLTPRGVVLQRNGQVTREAIRWFEYWDDVII